VSQVAVSYKKLWKILIDKEMKKQDLQKATGVSWGVITKLSKGETVSMEVLIKICRCLDCSIDDMLDILPEETDAEKV
jgi:DNA-binding Xre family transcriptional regulator